MSKKTIAFVTGGYSREAVISYQSAITIEKNIDKEKYNYYKIDITPNGWFYDGANGEKVSVNKDDFSIIVGNIRVKFDAVFIGIHGTPGEDGKLQGYFDLLNIPYTSCDAATSALTFNKRYTVAVAAFGGVKVAKSLHLFKAKRISSDNILQTIKLPVFVKPNNGGSSIGISKVVQKDDLEIALDKAFAEDDQVLVEEFIKGREFTVGVYMADGVIRTLPITEIKPTKEFFDYEAKYHGFCNEITPAVIDEDMAENLREQAIQVYSLLNCRGVIRVDFIYNENDNQPYMLEVNTVPGQSIASIVPQQIIAASITLQDFYSALIDECFNY